VLTRRTVRKSVSPWLELSIDELHGHDEGEVDIDVVHVHLVVLC